MADVSQIVLKDAQGNVIGTYDVKDASVPHDSKTASSGGNTLSLVTTGEKYNWNNKAINNLNDTAISSATNNDRLTYSNGKWVNENSVLIRSGKNFSIINGATTGTSVLSAYHSNGGRVEIRNNSGTQTILFTGSDGNVECTTVNDISIPAGVLQRGTFVGGTASYSADNMRGQTRFLYQAHGVPYTGTTVSFDSSNNENYPLQLNAKYSASASDARLSFRTRNGDASTWSNWLHCCPVYRFNPRLEANTNKTLYVPLEMRNGTAGDCFFLVASNNYGNSGLYFLTPNTIAAHQMVITTIKSSSYLTVAAISDDWGFKVTAGSAAYYLTLIRLS